MTLEEAKGKWCPMVRCFIVDSLGAVAVNADLGCRNADYARCIGPDCMMWSWVVEGETGYCGLKVDGATIVAMGA